MLPKNGFLILFSSKYMYITFKDEESDDQSESDNNQRVSSDNPPDTNDKPLQNDGTHSS